MANRIITDEMVLTLAKWVSPDAFVFGQEALSKQPAALARSRKILETLAPMFLAEAQWQPIETAPKDETPFLIAYGLTRNSNKTWARNGCFAIRLCRWNFYTRQWQVEVAGFPVPAHAYWMPLPPPPELK